METVSHLFFFLSLGRNVLIFTLLLSSLKDLVECVNIYGAVLLVEFMRSKGGLISVVKLTVSSLMLWLCIVVLCCGFGL